MRRIPINGTTSAQAVSSLEKALDVIDAVAKVGRAGVRSLAATTGYPPSTIHRLLASLTRQRYLRQDPVTREYRLSLRFLELGALVQENLDVVALARPRMRELMKAVGESVNLVVFEENEAIYVDQVRDTSSMLRMFTKVGARAPLYCSGVGKVFLAHQPRERVQDYWRRTAKSRHTPSTIVDEQHFLLEIQDIRGQGYAVDQEEMEQGVRCVAAAVFDGRGEVVAALSVSAPSTRLSVERTPLVGGLVRQAALAVSLELGYRPVSTVNQT